jgi:hypothetical protein
MVSPARDAPPFCSSFFTSLTVSFPLLNICVHKSLPLTFTTTGVNPSTLETAYKSGSPGRYGSCPSGMKSMPQLRFSIRYDLRSVLPKGWTGVAPLQLASGNAYSSHGDFINGWTEEGGKGLVAATAQKQKYISVNGALGGDGDKMACKATDADPKNGTGDYAQSVAAMNYAALHKMKREVPAIGWSSRSRMARSA